jgi:transposase
MQVADRWHLMENASSAFLDAVRKSMRAIRGAIGATTISPALLTSAEKLQYESYLRREETNAAIGALAREGLSIRQIVRRVGHSRNLVRQVLRGERTEVFPSRQSTIDAYLPFLDARSCPRAWCSSGGVITALAGMGRAGQAATAGSPTIGSSLKGAIVSSVM